MKLIVREPAPKHPGTREHPGITRRRFIAKSASGTFALWGLSLLPGCNSGPVEPSPDPPVDRLDKIARFFSEGDSADLRAIGNTYLEMMAPNPTPAEIEVICAPALMLIDTSTSDEEALEALEDSRAHDFQEAYLAEVGGWFLSETEVKLCAYWAYAAVV